MVSGYEFLEKSLVNRAIRAARPYQVHGRKPAVDHETIIVLLNLPDLVHSKFCLRTLQQPAVKFDAPDGVLICLQAETHFLDCDKVT